MDQQQIVPTPPPAPLPTPVPGAPTTPSRRRFSFIPVTIAAVILFIGLICAYAFVPGFTTTETPKVYRVGILSALDYFSPAADGFKEKMAELGYVEGQNITYDIQKTPAPVGNQAIVKKFVEDKVDLILAFPTEASLEAKEGTIGTGIPVVVLGVAIEGNNLVDSVQKPGGNLTGVRFPIPEIAAKRLEILHEIAPKVKMVMVPYLKDYPTVPPALEALRPLAASMGVTLIEMPFSTPGEVTAYVLAHPRPEVDAILTIPEPLAILPSFIDQILAYADMHNIPLVGALITNTDKGAIFSMFPGNKEMGQLAAPLADKIFRGTQAGMLPVVTPEVVLEINYKAILRLGLSVSEGLLSTANRVVH